MCLKTPRNTILNVITLCYNLLKIRIFDNIIGANPN